MVLKTGTWLILACIWAQGTVQSQHHKVIHDTTNARYGSLSIQPLFNYGVDLTANSFNYGLKVFTGECPPDPAQPAIWGEVTVVGKIIYFKPRMPFDPEVNYCFRLAQGIDTTWSQFKIDLSRRSLPNLISINPHQVKVPSNLLRIYLEFSHPMSANNPYDHIHLLDALGDTVKHAFYPAKPALWDANRTRLTLLFDPGRIKRGLQPNTDLGPALKSNAAYTLVIDSLLTDVSGNRMPSVFRYQFATAPPDRRMPSTENWQISTPSYDSRQPLLLHFDKPLDHAQLHRWIRIRDSHGQLVAGEISVNSAGDTWNFKPEKSWDTRRIQLEVNNQLEDLAGNSMRKPFELTDLSPEQLPPPSWIEIPVVLEH